MLYTGKHKQRCSLKAININETFLFNSYDGDKASLQR